MSNSCILFRKFHFLIGSFDHLCSTREISMWNCGTASSHKCSAISCWGTAGDSVSLSFQQMRSTQMVSPHTTHQPDSDKYIWNSNSTEHSLENGKLLRNLEREQARVQRKYNFTLLFLIKWKSEAFDWLLAVVRILIDLRKLDYIPDIGIPVWMLRIPLNWRFTK